MTGRRGQIRLLALCVIACSAFVACTASSHEKRVDGYPVYRFVNLSGVDSKFFKDHAAELKEALGEAYEPVVKRNNLFISHGFDSHTSLTVRTESGKDVELYIREADHKLLWKTNPYDLAEQKKSHRVSITYVPVNVGDEWVNRAVTFSAEMVDREPILIK
jgi:hypothetical protein